MASASVALLVAMVLTVAVHVEGNRKETLEEYLASQKSGCNNFYPKIVKLSRVDVTSWNNPELQRIRHLALARAKYLSYILQKNGKDLMPQLRRLPGLMYYFLAVASDLSSNDDVISSGVYYAKDMMYPNFDRLVYPNRTYPLFAPKATRGSPFNVSDVAGPGRHNYTIRHPDNESWFKRKQEYFDDGVRIFGKKTAANVLFPVKNPRIGDTFSMAIDPEVLLTVPYMDCNAKNPQWAVSAIAPVLDLLPKYTYWFYLRKFRAAALVKVDLNLTVLDVNSCELAGYSLLGHKCKEMTTKCKHIPGGGFRKDSYCCVCKPGFQLPQYQRGNPFTGSDILRATEEEYRLGFDCLPIDDSASIGELETQALFKKEQLYLERYPAEERDLSPPDTPQFDKMKHWRLNNMIKLKERVKRYNCGSEPAYNLTLREFDFDKANQSSAEAQARRLAHYLSAFLQTEDITLRDHYHLDRSNERSVTKDDHFGELAAILLADARIQSSAVYWEADKYKVWNRLTQQYDQRQRFAPFVWASGFYGVSAKDVWVAESYDYTHELFYRLAKYRAGKALSNGQIQTFEMAAFVREHGELINLPLKDQTYPWKYSAPSAAEGEWSDPYFDCFGKLQDWVVNYTVPFYGTNKEFMGVVSVTVALDSLDVQQCTGGYNATTTAVCHETTTCVPKSGGGFKRGSYSCVCKDGYIQSEEYAPEFEGFDGEMVEQEYEKKMRGEENAYERLACVKPGTTAS